MVNGCRLVVHIAGRMPSGGVVEGVPTGEQPGGVVAGGECGLPISVSISHNPRHQTPSRSEKSSYPP